jgi:protein TonB
MNPRHAPDESLRPSERLASWLIQRAARNSPPALSPRLEEEWLADLAAQCRGSSRLRFAIGCCWATRVIAHEHAGLRAPASSAATGSGLTVALSHQDPWLFSRRSMVFLLIAALHGLVIYAFANGLVHQVIEVLQPPPLVGIVTHPTPPDPAPSLQDPTFRITPISIPEPLIDPRIDAIPDDDAVSPPQQDSSSSTPSPPASAVNRVVGGPGQGFPNTDSFYPVAARRLGETGVAAVRVCVDDNGRLASEPLIARSSGSVRLDEGALKLAKAGSGHYRTTTENGRPVSFCYPLNVRFQLRN